MRQAVSEEKRVAVTLWFLATNAEYRTIAHLFGIGRSTVRVIVQETSRAIVSPQAFTVGVTSETGAVLMR